LDRDRSGSAIGDQWGDAQEARRQTRRARYTGFVSRKTDRHRAEISARQVQSAAACGPRGTAAGGRARMVGLSHGARGDVGAAQVGREVSHARQRRMRIGMQTGIAGLFLWSFLIANAHGAGLMLIPTLMPVCFSASPAGELVASSSFPIAVVVIGVHTAAMIAMIAVTALAVYKWVGLAFLRRGWVNLDLVWTVALGACGILLLGRGRGPSDRR